LSYVREDARTSVQVMSRADGVPVERGRGRAR
jgi:hypothetical protein